MNKKSLLFGIILCSGFVVAMDQEQKQQKSSDGQPVPKVDLTQLSSLDLTQLKKEDSPVRAASMPSPHHVDSPIGSPRPGNSPRPIERFLSQHNLASEKTGEALNRAIQRLKKCDAKLLELQGATGDRQREIREFTDWVKKLDAKVLKLERSHDDQQKVISEASAAVKDVMQFLLLTTQTKKVNSQSLRASPNRGVSFVSQSVAAPAVSSSSTSSSVATSSATIEDEKRGVDDQKSCSSDNDDDDQESDTN